MCFVIAPIGPEDSDIRKRSDQVFNHIITPVATKHGFKPIRADHISEPGIITSQVIQHVVDSELVVADLTGRNPNVFYELAIRHAIKKSFIQLIKKGETIPFDVAATRTIYIDIHDLDVAQKAREELEAQVKSLDVEDIEVDNPISTALDLKMFRESGRPDERAFAGIVDEITSLRNRLTNIEEILTDPTRILPEDYFRYIIRDVNFLQEPHLRRSLEMLSRTLLDITNILEKEEINKEDIENLQQATYIARRLLSEFEMIITRARARI